MEYMYNYKLDIKLVNCLQRSYKQDIKNTAILFILNT